MPSTIKESHENDEDNLAPPTRQENAEHSIESVKVDPDNEEDKLPDERDEENRTAKKKTTRRQPEAQPKPKGTNFDEKSEGKGKRTRYQESVDAEIPIDDPQAPKRQSTPGNSTPGNTTNINVGNIYNSTISDAFNDNSVNWNIYNSSNANDVKTTSSSSTAMTTQVPHRGLRILSLDGGGVKGLSSLLILEYLMKGINRKNPPRPCDIFDLIGGTSTGGLIAIMLGRLRMSVADAIDAYLELSKKVFAPKHRFNVIATLSNLSQAKGTCNTAALETAIKEIIAKQLGAGHEDDLLLEEDFLCRIFVCAIRADRRSLIRFRNFPAEDAADLQPKIWEAARATSAATTFFDPITIGKYEQTFVDGGGGYNNPVQEAYEEATACWDNPRRNIQCIVSIGTGKGSLKAFGRNLKQVGQTLIDIVTDTDEKAALFARVHPQFDREGANRRYFRFQVAQGLESVGMAEHKKIKEMAAATQIYMENTDQAGNKQLKLFKNLVGRT